MAYMGADLVTKRGRKFERVLFSVGNLRSSWASKSHLFSSLFSASNEGYDFLTTCAKSSSWRANAEIELGVQGLNGGSKYIIYEEKKRKSKIGQGKL